MSTNSYGNQSSQYEYAKVKLGKPVTEHMGKRTPHIDQHDDLTRIKVLKSSTPQKAYEVVFTYDAIDEHNKHIKGQSFTVFKHDRVLSLGEVAEIARKRIVENRFRDCKVVDLNFLNIHRRF